MVNRLLYKMNLVVLLFNIVSASSLQAQEDTWDKVRSAGKSAENLSEDLAGRLKLSDAQKKQLTDIMTNFHESLSSKTGDDARSEAERAAESADKETRRDHTRVEGETNEDATGTSSGNAQTKSQSQDEMGGTGRSTPVLFEKARTEADGRIEEMLSPDQALEYGKIKSDWWDKVKETVQPSVDKPNGSIKDENDIEGINQDENDIEGINQIDSTRK